MPKPEKHPIRVARGDSAFRYFASSSTRVRVNYLVDIRDYSHNGTCQCEHFTMNLEPILRRMVGPAEAVSRGLVKLKPGRRLQDALRCEHILAVREQFINDCILIMEQAEQK